MTYPDDCIQSLLGEWWVSAEKNVIKRGTLIWVMTQHADLPRQELIPTGRPDPRNHHLADLELQSLNIRAKHKPPPLPVAGLPHFPKERYLVSRGKVRPALVVSDLVKYPAKEKGASKWITAPSVLVAPCYGATPDGSRGGWPAPLVENVRLCQHAQYVWDQLPLGGITESVFRLDHVQPLRFNSADFDFTGWELTPNAVEVLDDWLLWYRTGTVAEGGVLQMAVEELPKAAAGS